MCQILNFEFVNEGIYCQVLNVSSEIQKNYERLQRSLSVEFNRQDSTSLNIVFE